MRAQDLAGRLGLLDAGRMVVGFDGFVDTLARPILSGNRPFDTSGALGEAIAGQAGKSCSIELEVISRRMGGNAPLVKYTVVKDTPHVYLQEESVAIWNEFFSRYSRGADGTLYYLVSYTHLRLPTIYPLKIVVLHVSFIIT